MRFLRRLKAEWRRKRSWREAVIILVVLQMVIFVSVILPRFSPQEPALPDDGVKRVGDFVLYFTSDKMPPGGHSGENGAVEEERVLRKPWAQNLSAAAEGDDADDPVLARGFQDEFVTFERREEVFLEEEEEEEEQKNIKIPDNPSGDREHATEEKNSESDKVTQKQFNSGTLLPKVVGQKANKVGEISIATKPTTEDESIHRNVINYTLNREYKFKNYNVKKPTKFILGDDKQSYFVEVNGKTCFAEGTDAEKTLPEHKKCRCRKHYFGDDCGIPEAAWHGRYKALYPDTRLRRRAVPRRIINGLPVNHEFAMFEARMFELSDVVDVFLVAESNYTAHGDPKATEFFDRFQRGYMADFQDKMVYIHLGFFAKESQKSGWIADSYLRYYMGIKGLPLLQGLRQDDLFVLSDADELPTRDVLLFLKLYDGYPEPVAFALRWTVFSFAWQTPADQSFWNWLSGTREKLTVVDSAATVGMLQQVLLNNTFYIRKKDLWKKDAVAASLEKYREEGHEVKDWTMGDIGHYAGWHCSWCFSPENIIKKMDSAQANDKPRWGDYPEKKNITYIKSRLWQGKWFDDTQKFLRVRNTGQRFYAPRFLLRHPDLYRSILFHPGHESNLNKMWRPP